MHHIGTITKTTKFPGLPFHAQCSCGPAGDFPSLAEADGYLTTHFDKQGRVSTFEIVDNTNKPELLPVSPISKPWVNDATQAHLDAVKAEADAKLNAKRPTPPESRRGVELAGETTLASDAGAPVEDGRPLTQPLPHPIDTPANRSPMVPKPPLK